MIYHSNGLDRHPLQHFPRAFRSTSNRLFSGSRGQIPARMLARKRIVSRSSPPHVHPPCHPEKFAQKPWHSCQNVPSISHSRVLTAPKVVFNQGDQSCQIHKPGVVDKVKEPLLKGRLQRPRTTILLSMDLTAFSLADASIRSATGSWKNTSLKSWRSRSWNKLNRNRKSFGVVEDPLISHENQYALSRGYKGSPIRPSSFGSEGALSDVLHPGEGFRLAISRTKISFDLSLLFFQQCHQHPAPQRHCLLLRGVFFIYLLHDLRGRPAFLVCRYIPGPDTSASCNNSNSTARFFGKLPGDQPSVLAAGTIAQRRICDQI